MSVREESSADNDLIKYDLPLMHIYTAYIPHLNRIPPASLCLFIFISKA